MAGTVTIGIGLLVGNGLPSRFGQRATNLFASKSDFNPRREECHNKLHVPMAYSENCIIGNSMSPSIAVWADSMGAELVVALSDRYGSAMQITASSCPPALNYDDPSQPGCRAHNHIMYRGLVNDPRIKTVLVAALYSHYVNEDDFLLGLEESIKGLQKAGKKVVLVYPVPEMNISVPKGLGLLAEQGNSLEKLSTPTFSFRTKNERVLVSLDRIAQENAVASIFPENVLCDEKLCFSYRRGVGPLYFDDVHLSLKGAKLVVDSWD